MALLIQPSFAKGVISPTLYGRVDTAAYQVALAKASNCIIHTYGGVSNRAGTNFIGPCKDHTYAPRLIPFQFKTSDQYMLEFGNLYMRVVRNDAHVTETALTGCTATAANPVVITKAAHEYTAGDEVFLSGFTEMVEVNNNRYIVGTVGDSGSTFELTSQADGTDIDGSGYTAETTGGSSAKIYQITTTYATADLDELKYTQSADTMTITHNSYPARDVTRTGHASWTIADVSFVPLQDHPTGCAVSPAVSTTETRVYGITAIKTKTFEESLTGLNSTSKTITGASKADPVVIDAADHGFLDGDEVEINSVGGMTELNGRRFIVANKDTNDFELLGVDGSGYTTYTSGGTANQTFVRITDSHGTEDNAITWTAEANAERYVIYRRDAGIWGFIGESTSTAFQDENYAPDTSVSPPLYHDPLSLEDDYPGTTSYFEQRQIYGGSINYPDTAYYSRTGDRTNFAAASPAAADDSFSATIASRQVNEIRHFVPLNDLLIFTSGSEWRVNSGPDTAFELASIRQKPQSLWGCNHLRPQIVGNVVFFIEETSAQVRSLGYSFQQDAYVGTNINLLANHLLKENTIVDWSLQKSPEVRFYMCRDDGQILTLTYDNEQEVIAWTTWNTTGDFERTAALDHASGESQDQIYFVVERTIDSNTVRYIEKLSSLMTSDDPADAQYVDSSLSLDTAITISGVTAADPVVVTATAHGFSDGDLVDISDIIWAPTTDEFFTDTQPIQAVGRYKIGEVATNTFEIATTGGKEVSAVTQASPGAVTTLFDHNYSTGDEIHFHDIGGMTELNGNGYTITVTGDKTFTIGVDSSGFGVYTSGGKSYLATDGSTWNAYKSGGKVREAVTLVRGLDHLEGETLVGNLDGNVVRSLTVSGGKITFPNSKSYSRAHIGMPFIADVETLDLEPPEGTIQGAQIKISNISVKFEASRGLVYGPVRGRTTETPSQLVEMKQREFERMGEPTRLLTGEKKLKMKPSWNSNGKILLRQKDPMPMNILSIAPDIQVGDLDDV